MSSKLYWGIGLTGITNIIVMLLFLAALTGYFYAVEFVLFVVFTLGLATMLFGLRSRLFYWAAIMFFTLGMLNFVALYFRTENAVLFVIATVISSAGLLLSTADEPKKREVQKKLNLKTYSTLDDLPPPTRPVVNKNVPKKAAKRPKKKTAKTKTATKK